MESQILLGRKYPPSETEKYLVCELINLGLNPQPQYQIGEMHVDIAFPDEKLVIEVNGPHHNSNEQSQRDIRRSIVAEKKGWRENPWQRIEYSATIEIPVRYLSAQL